MQGENDEFDRPLGFEEPPAHFTSASQKARVSTETWAAPWLSCPNCARRGLDHLPANSKVGDFRCPVCAEEFELKSTQKAFGRTVPDGAYSAMQSRLRARNNPNLLLLRYDRASLSATDLIVVPKHFFVLDIIKVRPPLGPSARRAGWVGCNILLDRIPLSGRIVLLKDRVPTPASVVQEQWRRTLFLRDASEMARGWLIEVMKAVEALGRSEFDLEDVYAAEAKLQTQYPNNRNIRPKIRQQLQVLRDKGYLQFIGHGVYRLTRVP
ncbi:DpnI domain-containing protein [Phenylobacterium sp.]|uniref:DpnI domain-containing protein n=1 Tax=Phenylobacterium sp. TaxID=1871053 RepID=UPI0039836222